MAEKSFPYNSIGGDRKYLAEDFREYFKMFIRNGVFYRNANVLKVKENDGMKVALSAGKAWIEGAGYINDSDLIITLDTADGALSRIDRVVIRHDLKLRKTYAALLKGAYSAQPVAQALTRNADAYEIAVADILIAGGTINITQSAITDTRLNNELCGIVTGFIEQADTTELYNQFEEFYKEFKAQYIADMENWTETKENGLTEWEEQQKADFLAWVEEIKKILDESVAGNLQNEIEAEKERAAKDAFMRYYGLSEQSTEFMADGSIVTKNSEATITTVKETDEAGQKTITETIEPEETEETGKKRIYKKITTIIPATETTNKKISEVYSSELQ